MNLPSTARAPRLVLALLALWTVLVAPLLVLGLESAVAEPQCRMACSLRGRECCCKNPALRGKAGHDHGAAPASRPPADHAQSHDRGHDHGHDHGSAAADPDPATAAGPLLPTATRLDDPRRFCHGPGAAVAGDRHGSTPALGRAGAVAIHDPGVVQAAARRDHVVLGRWPDPGLLPRPPPVPFSS